MLHVLLSTLLFFQLLSDSQNKNQAQAKTLPVMMTLFQRNRLVPMTSLNQQMVIPTCRRIASRFQCYLLMYFKMNDTSKTSCVLICLCCTSLQISFFFTLSVYIYQVHWHSFSGKIFSLKNVLTFNKADDKWVFFSQIWWKLNCFSIVSCLRVFSSPTIWIFFSNPDRTPQKI